MREKKFSEYHPLAQIGMILWLTLGGCVLIASFSGVGQKFKAPMWWKQHVTHEYMTDEEFHCLLASNANPRCLE